MRWMRSFQLCWVLGELWHPSKCADVEGLSHRETESVRAREGAVPKTDSIKEHLFEEKYNNKEIRRVPTVFKQKK